MHQIDRTLQELESNSGTNGEYENEYEFNGNGEFGQAFEQSFAQEANYENNETFEMGQNPELEMAYQLMEVSNEYELNQFIGGLMGKAFGAAKSAATSFINSPVGKNVGQYLVNFGKETLPRLATQYGQQGGGILGQRLGAAVGNKIGGSLGSKLGGYGQQAGTMAGGAAGSWLGNQAGNFVSSNAKRIFNLELEALSPENQELEINRSYVRFASDLIRQANQAVRQNPYLSISELGKQAITTTARQHAPGLLTSGQSPTLGAMNGSSTSGTWIRQGKNLIVYGI